MFGRRAKIGCVAAVVLLGAEGVVRLSEPYLPDPTEFHSVEADVKVAQMDELGSAVDMDVVFVGNSVMYDIEAAGFLFRPEGAIQAYNAALAEASLDLIARWTEAVVLPRLDPAVVVVGVTATDLVAPFPGRAAHEFTASMGWRRAAGIEGLTGAASRSLSRWSSLWAHRAVLRQPSTPMDVVSGTKPPVDAIGTSLGPRGRPTAMQDRTFGFPSVRHPARAEPWEATPFARSWLEHLVEAVEASEARLVIANLPASEEFEYIATDSASYARYLDWIRGFASDSGLTFIDLNLPGLRPLWLYRDPIHMSLIGVRFFTRYVSQTLDALGVLDGLD